MMMAAPSIEVIIFPRLLCLMDKTKLGKHSTPPTTKSTIVIHITHLLEKRFVSTPPNTMFDDEKEQSVNLNIIINCDYVN